MALITRQAIIRFIWQLHRFIYQATGGGVAGRVVGMPVLILHTIGNKTGRLHSNPLTYIPFNGSYLVAASNAGADAHPHWYRNLRANPQAHIQLGRKQVAVWAEFVRGEARAPLWERFKRAYVGYARYEQRTTREIPLVILEPRFE